MVIILVALPRRYYHTKIYNNSSVELSRDGLGECVSVGEEYYKPRLSTLLKASENKWIGVANRMKMSFSVQMGIF